MLRFAIVGAGLGGQTMAAVLTQEGYEVRLYDIDKEKIAALQKLDHITIAGVIEAKAKPAVITTDIAEAVHDADIIMVVTTADAHGSVAEQLKPLIKDGQIIVLNPGQCGGALEVANVLRGMNGSNANVFIGETGDLMYGCRSPELGTVVHRARKVDVPFSAYPSTDTQKILDIIGPIFPNLKAVSSILDTGFEGGGAMLHTIPTVMNINKMDLNESYDYYVEGITPHIADIIEKCDEERCKVCATLGIEAMSLKDRLTKTYKLESKDTLYELIQSIPNYKGVACPKNIRHRFIVEDTMTGLVPLACIGHEIGVETPYMDAFIFLAGTICNRNYWAEGRNAERLGLAGKTAVEIRELVR